jgi:hypothetical protein
MQYDDRNDPDYPDELFARCRKNSINWVVLIKHRIHDSKASARENATVKVKDILRKTEYEGWFLPLYTTLMYTTIDHIFASYKG